jgi:hypothetical protein
LLSLAARREHVTNARAGVWLPASSAAAASGQLLDPEPERSDAAAKVLQSVATLLLTHGRVMHEAKKAIESLALVLPLLYQISPHEFSCGQQLWPEQGGGERNLLKSLTDGGFGKVHDARLTSERRSHT